MPTTSERYRELRYEMHKIDLAIKAIDLRREKAEESSQQTADTSGGTAGDDKKEAVE